MRKLKQLISVFLCAALCVSAFALNAQAKTKKKTVKKYVTSISVAKKATITIPAAKKTATKSYKVTVKVKNKASKAFTAKSSKTSVATVKVSGSSIKVTAKKAGKTTITVTSKAKNSKGNKLSAKLTLTVKKAKKIIPASIAAYYESVNLRFNSYVDTDKLTNSYVDVLELVSNANPDAAYYAETADSSVAEMQLRRTRIGAVAAGETTVDIFEELNSVTRKLGTLPVVVEELTMAQAAEDVLLGNTDKDFNSLWLKPNLGKNSYDFGAALKNALNENEAIGTKFKSDDYTLSYSITGENTAAVSEEGVITPVKNGDNYVNANVKFSDGSEAVFVNCVTVSGLALEKVEVYTIDNVRDYIVGVNTPIELADGTKQPLINFDNAATTPAFKAVQDAVNEELEMYGSIGRGYSQKSNHSTDVYNSVRDKVLDFFTADPELYTCFYVNSTTDGLNKLASALVESEDDIVLTTRIEHHANDLSWRERCKVIYAEVDEKGRVIYDDIEKLLKKNNVKIVSISAASNVTGYVNDVHRVAKLAHKYGAMIVVDGAQIVAHRQFYMMGDLNDPMDDIDFIAFSAHKMYSPYGGGAVVGLTEILNQHMPEFYGGGTITVVGDYWQYYKTAPAAYEAGSPNYPGVVGLGKAVDVLSTIGMDNVEAHEKVLNRKIIDGLKTLPNVIIYGDTENIDDKVGVVTFNFTDINTTFISRELSQLGGVATRRGAFCAHPYVWRLMGIDDETAKSFANCSDVNTAGMVRVSFGIYNTEAEVDQFLNLMPTVMAAAANDQAYSTAVPKY